jgi:hypothetical protein
LKLIARPHISMAKTSGKRDAFLRIRLREKVERCAG